MSGRDGLSLFGAGSVELELAVGSEETPVVLVHGLAVVTNAGRLPGLVVGLEVEQIDTPVEHAADTGLPEGLGILGTSQGILVVRTAVYRWFTKQNSLVKDDQISAH